MDIINKIIQGDTIEVMKQIPDKTFDFCFADPPYFMQIGEGKKLYRVEGSEFDGCDDEWDKFDSMAAYVEWTRKWLIEVRRVLKDNGTICVISGMQSIFEIGAILRELGYWVINDIIWQKSNPTPNFGGTRLNNSHETLIWASKSKKSRFSFNYKTGKYLNGDKQMGSIWTCPVCSGNERIRDENDEKVHNTQKPEALLYRLIVLFTNQGDLILDPFGGTMTTGAVAKKTGRRYTMIERDEKYIKYGQIRLDKVVEEIGDVESAVFDIKPIKVSIEEMVKAGYFIIGESFIHKNGERASLADSKGKITYNGKTDSMHEIAAKMMGGLRRVNAFDYLFVERDGKLVSISEVRDDYRKHILEKANSDD
ncbi:MAG TPA: site-specific DNA-methyltransferase [Bacilli bacterium]|jgi:site-specific DNA-methyltransferase (adenine-specific)|nr:site-specific DNA-methyltransferase [Bacilli bacterium]HPX46365.1 site-specific DNA-methyltransferase [Bacteroidales bacterium]HQB96194.1 site-specific DNA-methyltransferase [Bacilli bacterium]HQP90173.1 site-specific DNA-methyltransferase [Bacteroidales bacterium]